jgi:hypothetical protein
MTTPKRQLEWLHTPKGKAALARSEAKRKLRLKDLKNRPCMDCGGRFPPECMDFDHVRGVKVMGISHLYRYSMDRLTKELAKCELVCANCHRIRTKARRKLL